MIKGQMYGRAAFPSCASASSSTLGNRGCIFGVRARSTGRIRDSGAVDSPEIGVMPAPGMAVWVFLPAAASAPRRYEGDLAVYLLPEQGAVVLG
jgi:hypothetical protein